MAPQAHGRAADEECAYPLAVKKLVKAAPPLVVPPLSLPQAHDSMRLREERENKRWSRLCAQTSNRRKAAGVLYPVLAKYKAMQTYFFLAACCSSPSLILPTSACPKLSVSGRQQLLFTPAPETKSGVPTTCGEPTKASKTDLPEERVRKPLHGVLYGKHGARHQSSSDLPAPAARARFPAPVRAPAD